MCIVYIVVFYVYVLDLKFAFVLNTVGVRLGDSHGGVVVSPVLHGADLPPLGGVRVKLQDLCTVRSQAGAGRGGQHSPAR